MSSTTIAYRILDQSREHGFMEVARSCASWGFRWMTGRAGINRRSLDSFWYDGTEYEIMRHRYCYTWLNERAVEVRLGLSVLDAAGGGRVLEVGNVLSHFREVDHTVVDKYEQAPGVHNVDVVDLDLPDRYDLIISISTLEHVGFDEEPKDPGKPARAVARLTELLAPGGRLWCTVPPGYNPSLDADLQAGRLGFTRLTALRSDRSGKWTEIPIERAWDGYYDWLLFTARTIVVAELVKPV